MNRPLPAAALLCLLAACATSTPSPPAPPEFDAAAAVAAIRAAGTAAASELVIRPLGDPQVEDLRQQAATLQVQGRHAEAAAALDQALSISPDDPALLQERAEAALLLHDLDTAERLARRALAIGTEVGPQCRRHWETIVQVLAVRPAAGSDPTGPDPASGATPEPTIDEARRKRDACTVAAPPRY